MPAPSCGADDLGPLASGSRRAAGPLASLRGSRRAAAGELLPHWKTGPFTLRAADSDSVRLFDPAQYSESRCPSLSRSHSGRAA